VVENVAFEKQHHVSLGKIGATAEMAVECLKAILGVFTDKVHMKNDCAALVTEL
jgi:hypothetical protein